MSDEGLGLSIRGEYGTEEHVSPPTSSQPCHIVCVNILKLVLSGIWQWQRSWPPSGVISSSSGGGSHSAAWGAPSIGARLTASLPGEGLRALQTLR